MTQLEWLNVALIVLVLGGSDALVVPTQPEAILSTDISSGKFEFVSSLIQGGNESLDATKASVGDLVSGVNESFNAAVNKGEDVLRSSLDTATSFVDSIVKNATTSADNAFSKVFSSVGQTGDLASKKITSVSSGINGVTSKALALVIDVLRHTFIVGESSLSKGVSYVVYLYGSVKEVLPAEIKDSVNVYEGKATQILNVGK
ncbi:calcium sensing receptor, chloroplastic [Trifolium repens]|nr:calcium sensing receptor, chloroplastic [Trifolium repens]